MTSYTPAEAHMCRMILARNHLIPLHRLFFEGGINPSFTSCRGVLHLVQFLDAYHGLMGSLTPQQKKRVLCVTDLISGVTRHAKALRKMRNEWLAHLPDDGGFAEGAPDFFKRVELSDNPEVYHEMFICVDKFVDTARALLPDIAGPAVEKFNRTSGVRVPHHWISRDRIVRNARARLEAAQKAAEQELPGMPWGFLLDAAGVPLEPMGTDDPRADIFRWKDHWDGGASRE